jgi:hypothetical protein
MRLGALDRKAPQGFAKQKNNLGVVLKRRRIVRTAEVTVETEEKTVLRGSQGQRLTLMWCPACQREVEMVTPEQAAQIASVEERAVYGWVEAGTVHFIAVDLRFSVVSQHVRFQGEDFMSPSHRVGELLRKLAGLVCLLGLCLQAPAQTPGASTQPNAAPSSDPTLTQQIRPDGSISRVEEP